MKKLHPLLSVLFLISIGFGQQIIPQITETYENGNIKSITYHKKIRDSIVKVKVEVYFENGQKESESNYKDEELDGLETWWYENGQKKSGGTFKDGDGLETWWYENGQKESEVTYKDGEIISEKWWNEDGSVME